MLSSYKTEAEGGGKLPLSSTLFCGGVILSCHYSVVIPFRDRWSELLVCVDLGV